MNRGSEQMRDLSDTGPTGFNEAPIHESGKFDVRKQSGATQTELQ